MDMTTAFPGAHYKAADLAGQPRTLTVASVVMGKVGDDQKPLMKFYEGEQDLVLNVTNSNTLVAAWGSESAAWVGKQVQIYPTKVQFGAEMVDAIRVTPMAAGAAGSPPPAVAPGAGAAPAPAPAPAPAAGLTMTAAANGVTYEAYKAQGWQDEQLIAQGLAVAPAPVAPAPVAPAPVAPAPVAPAPVAPAPVAPAPVT